MRVQHRDTVYTIYFLSLSSKLKPSPSHWIGYTYSFADNYAICQQADDQSRHSYKNTQVVPPSTVDFLCICELMQTGKSVYRSCSLFHTYSRWYQFQTIATHSLYTVRAQIEAVSKLHSTHNHALLPHTVFMKKKNFANSWQRLCQSDSNFKRNVSDRNAHWWAYYHYVGLVLEHICTHALNHLRLKGWLLLKQCLYNRRYKSVYAI